MVLKLITYYDSFYRPQIYLTQNLYKDHQHNQTFLDRDLIYLLKIVTYIIKKAFQTIQKNKKIVFKDKKPKNLQMQTFN